VCQFDRLRIVILIPAPGVRSYNDDPQDKDASDILFISQQNIALAINIFYVVSTGLLKSSVLLFYRRAGPKAFTTSFVMVVRLMIASVTIATVGCLVAFLCVCSPPLASKDTAGSNSDIIICPNSTATALSTHIISCIQNFVTATLPVALLWKLPFSTLRRGLFAAIFVLGYVACAAGIPRVYYTGLALQKGEDSRVASIWRSWIWMIVEILLAVTAANAPALGTFIRGTRQGAMTANELMRRRMSSFASLKAYERGIVLCYGFWNFLWRRWHVEPADPVVEAEPEKKIGVQIEEGQPKVAKEGPYHWRHSRATSRQFSQFSVVGNWGALSDAGDREEMPDRRASIAERRVVLKIQNACEV